MSHLPPRPEFDYPPRADSRYYGRPAPPPDHIYPPRERDVYRSSPPRPKHPPRVDSYVAPADSYVPRPPYPPYDRHEEGRYRDYRVRDWERRDRNYPPPSYRGDSRDWRGRDRRWDDDRSRTYERDRRERSPPRERPANWTRPREDDRRPARERARPPSPERTWIPRASKSPPRRMVSSSRPPGPGEASVSRTRSPQSSPRRRPQSPPSTRYVSPPSPPSRRTSPRPDIPGNIRLGNHSISVSPRHPQSHAHPVPSRQARHPEDRERERGSWRRSRRSHSRSWSRSCSRSPVRRSRSRSRSPRRRDESRGRGRGRSRGRSRATDSEPGVAHSHERTPRDSKPLLQRSPSIRPAVQQSLERAVSPSSVKQEPAEESVLVKPAPSEQKVEIKTEPSSEDVRMASPPTAATSPSCKATPTLTPISACQTHKPHGSSSPAPSVPTHPRHRDYVKTPTTPLSPQVNSPFTPLPPKPDWTSRASTVSVSTPPTSAEPPPAPEAERDVPLPDLPAIPQWRRPSGAPEFISPELARILTRKERVIADYETAASEARRALHEYDMACIDLRFAEKKRKIADEQLELARAGVFGIDYKPPATE